MELPEAKHVKVGSPACELDLCLQAAGTLVHHAGRIRLNMSTHQVSDP